MARRILQIIPSLDRAGAEKQLCLLAAGLPRGEFEVHVCALTRGGPIAEPLRRAGVPVHIIGKRWRLDPQSFWKLRRHVARVRPDLVHGWMFAAGAYGFAAAGQCGRRPFVLGQRCVDPWKSTAQLAVDRYIGRRCARVVVNSAAVGNFYVGHGTPAEKVLVIANGVPEPAPSPVSRSQLLGELELPADARLVGLVGRLWPQKRVKDAIWAADLLKVIRDDVHLLLIGDGPQRDRLRKFRDQVRIRDKVHFLGERHDVARLLPHFDALWSTSGYEGQSNALMEAMAAGVAVVATDIPGTRDLIEHGRSGLLFPVGDRAELARHTNKLLDDRALAGQLGSAARQRMLSEFSVRKMVDRYAALYRELLG